jgi:hypothetical protein
MVFNATFNNISVILWWSILLVEEIKVPGENDRPAYHTLTILVSSPAGNVKHIHIYYN